MGVSITAMSNLRLLPEHERMDDCWDNHITAYTYSCFARSAEGLADAEVKTKLGASEMVAQRCYEETEKTVTASVLDMSYHGYNIWRDQLCKTVNGFDAKEAWCRPDAVIPFGDIIHFADNEGCIGPVAAARLRDDFRNPAYRVVRDTFSDGMQRRYFVEAWDGWLNGCELAANGGLIRFS